MTDWLNYGIYETTFGDHSDATSDASEDASARLLMGQLMAIAINRLLDQIQIAVYYPTKTSRP